MKGLGNILRFWAREFMLTLSNEKSLLSSKRLERFILFWTALSIIITYSYKHMETLSASDVLLITGALFAYAGFNSFMNRKDKLDTVLQDKPNDTTP